MAPGARFNPGARTARAEVRRALDRHRERLITFYQLPREHQKHLRTSNPVESRFAAVRLRTAAASRFEKVENATAVIWKTLLIAEKMLRRPDVPELLADVARGEVYVNGVRAVNPRSEGADPDLIPTLLDETSAPVTTRDCRPDQ